MRGSLTFDTSDEHGRQELIRSLKARQAWDSLFEFRDWLLTKLHQQDETDLQDAYRQLLVILHNNRIDLDFESEPPGLDDLQKITSLLR